MSKKQAFIQNFLLKPKHFFIFQENSNKFKKYGNGDIGRTEFRPGNYS